MQKCLTRRRFGEILVPYATPILIALARLSQPRATSARRRVRRDARQTDPQPLYEPAHAISMDNQPVSWMRIWLRLLLRTLYARISRTARSDGFRAPHFH